MDHKKFNLFKHAPEGLLMYSVSHNQPLCVLTVKYCTFIEQQAE